jgi:hypothetical protein
MSPATLLSSRGHVIDGLGKLVSDALFMHEKPQALWIRKGRR